MGLAENLHVIDFEQLKIENQTLNEKLKPEPARLDQELASQRDLVAKTKHERDDFRVENSKPPANGYPQLGLAREGLRAALGVDPGHEAVDHGQEAEAPQAPARDRFGQHDGGLELARRRSSPREVCESR